MQTLSATAPFDLISPHLFLLLASDIVLPKGVRKRKKYKREEMLQIQSSERQEREKGEEWERQGNKAAKETEIEEGLATQKLIVILFVFLTLACLLSLWFCFVSFSGLFFPLHALSSFPAFVFLFLRRLFALHD